MAEGLEVHRGAREVLSEAVVDLVGDDAPFPLLGLEEFLENLPLGVERRLGGQECPLIV